MTTWHAPPDTLVQFARSPETVDEVTAASVEQHLVACAACRAVVAGATDTALLRRSWAEVADAIDRPRENLLERALGHLGMPPHLARIVGATPQLRVAWLTTTVLLAAAAVAVARDSGSDAPFLVVAPLVPLAAALLVFLPTEEPGGEAALATPLHGAGLLLRRVAAILVPTFAILALAGLAQPDLTAGGAAWVLPGLALTLSSLALSTTMRASAATTMLGVGWVSLIAAVSALDGRTAPIAESVLFAVPGQAGAVLISVLAAVWLAAHRDRFSTMEVTW